MTTAQKTTFIKLCLASWFLAIIVGCTSSNIDPRLEQAVKSAKYMTSQKFLSRSAFKSIYPEQKPSNFVQYIFSTMGSAEWPIAFDEGEKEQLRSIGVPIMPNNLAIVPNKPDPKNDLQVVLKADDEAGFVIIEAYEQSIEKPVLVLKRKIGR